MCCKYNFPNHRWPGRRRNTGDGFLRQSQGKDQLQRSVCGINAWGDGHEDTISTSQTRQDDTIVNKIETQIIQEDEGRKY